MSAITLPENLSGDPALARAADPRVAVGAIIREIFDIDITANIYADIARDDDQEIDLIGHASDDRFFAYTLTDGNPDKDELHISEKHLASDVTGLTLIRAAYFRALHAINALPNAIACICFDSWPAEGDDEGDIVEDIDLRVSFTPRG